MPSIKLNIPYRSQWDNDASRHVADCGPTCLAMILNSAGKQITPDRVYDFIRPIAFNQFTNFNDLWAAARDNGVTMSYKKYDDQGTAMMGLWENLNAGKPVIALVNYAKWGSKSGNNFAGGHFVVVVGNDDTHIYVHDPIFGNDARQPRDNGANYAWTKADFLAGWSGFTPDVNPNFACMFTVESVNNVENAGTIPTPVEDPDGISDTLRRRILSLAAYISAEPPDLSNPALAKFWQDNLGDWGADTKTYVVKSGDTYRGIAYQHYGDGNRWRTLRAYNDLTADWVFVGQRIRIPLMGNDNPDDNHKLPADTVSFDITTESTDPTAEAIDYADLAENTAGMGFMPEE